MKNSEMERLSVIDDDFELQGPNVNHSKYNPFTKLRKFWIYHPKSACGVLSLFILLPFIISLGIIASKHDDSQLITQTTDCDTSNAWAKSFNVETYGNGIVAADDYRCSKIGSNILTDGGNAMDAAIGVALCLGVVSPASSGLGGGCFILGYNASSYKSLFIDARETAPLNSSQNMYVGNPSLSVNGGLAIAIPGELKGLYLAWQKQGGGVSWSRIVQPSIDLAKKWEISPTVARYILKIETVVKSNTMLYSDIYEMYFNNDGTPKKSGQYIQNPQLANTLQGIADQGPDYLYGINSNIPNLLAKEIQNAGGIITANEIRSFQPTIRDAVEMDVFGYKLYGAPPPSSGGVIVAAILQFMSGFKEPIASQEGLYYHHLVEAMKHTFAIRMSLGDPDYVNLTSVMNDLLNGDLINELQQITREDWVLDSIEKYGGPDYGVKYQVIPDDHGTTHISVLDKDGNAVAITSTVNTYFGSKILSTSTGIILNNEMDDFSTPNSSNFFGLAPFTSNYIEPGKKPLSSMSPTILVRKADKKVRLIGGASGGPRIITATAQVLLNFLGQGMSLLDSVISSRVHSQLFPQKVYLEDVTLDCTNCLALDSNGKPISGQYQKIQSTTNTLLVNALKKRGHNITADTGANFGVCQFIDIEHELDNKMTAVCDPRKGGTPSAAEKSTS